MKKSKDKMAKVIGEFKAGTLHSGSKKGPVVREPKQAIAIGMSEMKRSEAKALSKKVGDRIEGKKRKSAMY